MMLLYCLHMGDLKPEEQVVACVPDDLVTIVLGVLLGRQCVHPMVRSAGLITL